MYPHAGLWTAHSLYFFWRDLAVVRGDSPFLSKFPTYLNFRNPIDVALGPGLGRWWVTRILDYAREWCMWCFPVVRPVLGMLGLRNENLGSPGICNNI